MTWRNAVRQLWGRLHNVTLFQAVSPSRDQVAQERVIFDFKDPAVRSQWICDTDRSIGGKSTATLEVKDGLGTFAGNLSLEKPKNISFSGYCAIRSKHRPRSWLKPQSIDLRGSSSLHFRVRGDGRTYVVNVQVESYVPNELYQSFLATKRDVGWETIKLNLGFNWQIPFSKFVLTHQGFIQHEQIKLTGKGIQSLGILLADKKEGEFRLDIEWIKAVHESRTEIQKEDETSTG